MRDVLGINVLLTMQSCPFAKIVIDHVSGRFSTARPAAVWSSELQKSCSRPCFLCDRNQCTMLAMKFSRVRLRVRLSWGSQMLLSHVQGLGTALMRQGEVTDFFSSKQFFFFGASCGRFRFFFEGRMFRPCFYFCLRYRPEDLQFGEPALFVKNDVHVLLVSLAFILLEVDTFVCYKR